MLTFHCFCSESTARARAGTRGGPRGLYPKSLFSVLRSGATCLFTTLGVTAACFGLLGRFMEPELQKHTDASPTDSRALRSSPQEECAVPPLHRRTSPAPRPHLAPAPTTASKAGAGSSRDPAARRKCIKCLAVKQPARQA